MLVWGDGQIEVGLAITPGETIPLLDTIHVNIIQGVFGYLVKIVLNFWPVKTK